MKVKELVAELLKQDGERAVLFKDSQSGKIAEIFFVSTGDYLFFGRNLPCVYLSEEKEKRAKSN